MFKLTFEGFHQLEINKDIQKEETAQVKDIAEWNIVASGSRRQLSVLGLETWKGILIDGPEK